MKWFFYVIIIVWLGYSLSTPENCVHNDTSTAADCNFTDHSSYLKCIHKRLKRQTGCEEDNSFSSNGSTENCLECDCNQCSENRCGSPCSTCCSPCKTRPCCLKTCHAQCTTSTCRRSCRKSCMGGTNGTVAHNSTSNHLHNVTTVIKVQNVIKNSNVIDVPVNVKNNVTTGLPQSNLTTQKCCQIIGPRQCISYFQFPFVKCYHHSKHVCGSICQSGIMYAQPHQICDERPPGPPHCHGRVIYIPQPPLTSTWPYLSRGPCPYQHPWPWGGFPRGGFSSPDFGFSSPAVYPVYPGLLGYPEMPASFPHQHGNPPGSPVVPGSRNLTYAVNVNNSLFRDDLIQAEVIQQARPPNFLDDARYAIVNNNKTIQSAEPVRGDAVIIIE